MQIRTMAIAQIKLAAYNPRKDLQPGDPEYERIKRSLLEYDLIEPLIWNKRTGNLVGGHQRLKVLQELGHDKVQVSVVDLPEDKEKALNLALNKVQGEWDLSALKDLLQELDTGAFDMQITGFDMPELEELMTQIHVWQPDQDVIEGAGERTRRIIITFANDAEELAFWAKFGRDYISTNRVLYRWKDLHD